METDTPDPFALVKGRDFDCTARSIVVHADRYGASVHEASVRLRGRGFDVRVLAHDQRSADEAAVNYVRAKHNL